MHHSRLSILTVTVVLLTALSANPAVVHESLQIELNRLAGGKTVQAIVFFKHQADIGSLNKQLKAERATLAERHHRVITALQQAATQTQPSAAAFLDQLKVRGLVTDYRFHWIVNAFYVEAYPAGIRALAGRQDIDIIYPNFPIELIKPVDRGDDGGLLLGHEIGLERINAPAAWEQGWTGAGRVVMNIDTGVDGTHPALADRFRGDVDGDGDYDESWLDPYDTHWAYPQDSGSHGTHTMGTICGRTRNGDTIGVAIDAQWIAAAPVDRESLNRTIADILVSFEWAADPDGDPGTPDNPDAIGNSWGIPDGWGYRDCDSTFWQVIDNVEAVGSVVIFSAGNEGNNGLRSPADRAATLYNVFSVGAVDGNDPNLPIAGFSARGPTECSREEPLNIKPEVVAPGVNVRSSVPGGYANYSGTSMSSPHITGAVAVIRQVNPDLDVDSIKAILIATAEEVPADEFEGEDNTYGNGIINLYEACLQAQIGYGYLQGQVTDSDHNGIGGARIQIVDAPRFTFADQDGFYFMGVPGDTTYAIEASAIGYLPEEIEAFVASQETTTVDFILQQSPTGSLHGTVISAEDSSPISGANVEVVDTNIDPVQTDESGYYEFPEIPGGSIYTIRVTASGFGIGEDEVYIPPGGEVELNFALTPVESFENDNGGWLGEGVWEWGQPSSGPGSAFDGANVWATVLGGDYGINLYDLLASSFIQVDQPSASLSFHHWYDFERGFQAWDGGNVSVRVLGEQSWEIIEPDGGYPEDTVVGLNGEPGYSGITGDWVEETFQLGAYEGSVVQFGLRIGTDESVGRPGWYIDAVALSGVTVLPFPHIEVDPAGFHVTLEQGQSTVRNLTISNPTDGFLIFQIDPRTENRLLGDSEPRLPLIQETENQPDKGFLEYESDGESYKITYSGPKPDNPRGPSNPPMTLDRGGPDEFGYTWVDSNEPDGPVFEWVDITGEGQPVPFDDDQNRGPFYLGFSMPFYGNSLDFIRICSNGWLSFTSTSTDYSNDPIPDITEPNDLLAPFWDDLNPEDGGTIYFYTNTVDSAVVAWIEVPHYQYDGEEGIYTFEAILTAQGKILYQYASMEGELASNTVGIENGDGTVGLQIAFDQSYIADGLAISISPPLTWLSADPLSGLVMPDGSTDIDVGFDAADLDVDTYAGYLNILCNDPEEPTLIVPCTLTVTGLTGIDDETGIIPDRFGLEQNYPNPFNPSTRISFSLPVRSEVNLVIYDLLGRQVKNLFSGELQAGYHLMTWDGTDDTGNSAPSGVYFYRLKAGDVQESRKMVMLK